MSSGLIKNSEFCKFCNKKYKLNSKWLLPHELKCYRNQENSKPTKDNLSFEANVNAKSKPYLNHLLLVQSISLSKKNQSC